MYPHLNISDVVGAVHLPGDGQCDPANIAMALAKGARMRGAEIAEGVKVTRVLHSGGRVSGVEWEDASGATGQISCDLVVNCGGMWGRELARSVGGDAATACLRAFLYRNGTRGGFVDPAGAAGS